MSIEIEKGIPFPGRGKYPFSKLDVGDSFFVPGGNTILVTAAAYGAGTRLNAHFTCRTVDGGVRVWRTE